MTNEELIQTAEKVLNPVTKDGRLHGDVGAAVLGKNGKVYVGTCVDTPSWGLCAERSAFAAMITDGEYKFDKVVAVWKDDKTGKLYVLPPCGVCREFMRQIDQGNLESEVILGKTDVKKLMELIPYYEWPAPLE
ncbi:MAG: cytidine deaminase [Candidatus Yanofskybacteria bacterium]|nr:cytidine deaminase [Candidatus Yanofskybacteria bacterium]